ncbi:MAG: hypothetical protein EA375_03250 [Acholeplasmataceae bacterium]|nr:MAG: hypothetical protein EA375_03250 [Acholeplasmataceae bacterium]
MKKLTWLAVFVLMLMVLAACRGDGLEEVEAVLSIDDIILVEGQSHIITYTITPSYLLSHDVDITYLIMDQSPRGYGVIYFSGHHLGDLLEAQEAGTATIKAVAVNTLGSDYVFHAETTFTVTVLPLEDLGDEYVKNGSFEDGLQDWTVSSSHESVSYYAAPVSTPHTGHFGFEMNFRDEGIEEPMTITLSQSITYVPAGSYRFSLWYQGMVFALTMTVRIGSEVVATETFSGVGYDEIPEHEYYANFGIDVFVPTDSDLTIEIHVIGNNLEDPKTSYWGIVDTVSFQSVQLVHGHEFVKNGMFDDSLAYWHVTSSDPSILFGPDEYYEMHSGDAALMLHFPFSHDALTFTLSQLITDVPAGVYWFSSWYMGNVFSLTMTVYIDDQIVGTETFSGEAYDAVPGHHGYANFGIEVEIEADSDLTIEIHIIGNHLEHLLDFTWAFVDTISFRALHLPYEPVLSIDDITLVEGDTHVIDYQLFPDIFEDVHITYEILEQTPAGVISISSSTLYADAAGTALIKAVAVNAPGADRIFQAETTFTVTVLPGEDENGELVKNGRFDDELAHWTITASHADVDYGLVHIEEYTHSGQHALYVYFFDADQAEEPMTLTLSQLLSGVPPGTYLFSFWYKGTAFSLSMTAWIDNWIVESMSFSGQYYDDRPFENGYAQFVIEVYIEVESDLTIEIQLIGNNSEYQEESEVWVQLDTISFKEGYIDDWIIPMVGK